MPKQYTHQQTIDLLDEIIYKNQSVNILYTHKMVNWSGTTKKESENDVQQKYSEVISDYLLRHWDDWCDNIQIVPRQNYESETHDGIIAAETNRIEEIIAKEMYNHTYDYIGHITDYQVPLKEKQSDAGVGKVDLISEDAENIYLLELKKADNENDSLLRSALEAYTYSKQINRDKFTSKNIIPAVLIFQDSRQHRECNCDQYPKTRELIEMLGCQIFVMTGTLHGENYRVLGTADEILCNA